MGFVVAAIYFAIIFIRPQDWISGMGGLPIVDWIAFPAIAVVAFYSIPQSSTTGQQKTHNTRWKSAQVLCLMGFYFAIVWSYVWKTHITMINREWQFCLRFIVPSLAIIFTTTSRRRVQILLIIFGVALLIFSYHGYLQYTTGRGLDGRPPMGGFGPTCRTRAFGIFDGANEFGTLFAVGLVICAAFIRNNLPNIFKCALTIPFIYVFGPNLWWTQSRQSLLTVSFGVAVAFAPKRLYNSWLGIAIGIALLLGMMQFHSRWAGGNLSSDNSVRKRAQVITEGLRGFKRKPLIGYGRGRQHDVIGLHLSAHNSYLIVALENGLFGLFFYVSIIGLTAFQLFYIMRMDPETADEKADVKMARMLLAITAAVFGGAYFQNRPYHTDSFLYLAIGIAFCITMYEKYGDKLMPGLFRLDWFLRRGFIYFAGASCAMIFLIHLTARFFWLGIV